MEISKLNKYTMYSLFLVLIIDGMGAGLVFPLLGPLVMSKTGGIIAAGTSELTRDWLYGIALASFCVFMFFGAPFLGDLSDHIGRKKVLLLCLYGTAVGLLISAWGVAINSLVLLVIGRVIAGFLCGSQALAQAAIVDMSTEENKAANLSFISLAGCLGFVVGPFMAGLLTTPVFIAKVGYVAPFIAAALLAAINGTGLWLTFRETFVPKITRQLRITRGFDVFVSAFTNVTIRKLTLVYALVELGFTLYFQYMPLYLIKQFAYTSVHIGRFMSFMGLLFGFSLLFIIRIVSKFFDSRQVALYSFVLTMLGMLMMLLANEWVVWVSAVPISVGSALFYVALLTLFSDAVSVDEQGWVMGVFAAVAAFAWSVGGTFCAVLDVFWVHMPFVVAAMLLLLGTIIFTVCKK